MGLARVAAATLNDRQEAVQYARAGLALWSEARLEVPSMRQLKNFETWESYPKAYAALDPSVRRTLQASLDDVRKEVGQWGRQEPDQAEAR
jgi:hypothetical protein